MVNKTDFYIVVDITYIDFCDDYANTILFIGKTLDECNNYLRTYGEFKFDNNGCCSIPTTGYYPIQLSLLTPTTNISKPCRV